VRTLATAVGDLIADQKAARQQGIRARKVVLDNQGATDRTADRLVGLLTRK